jgi:hypothetical protein
LVSSSPTQQSLLMSSTPPKQSKYVVTSPSKTLAKPWLSPPWWAVAATAGNSGVTGLGNRIREENGAHDVMYCAHVASAQADDLAVEAAAAGLLCAAAASQEAGAAGTKPQSQRVQLLVGCMSACRVAHDDSSPHTRVCGCGPTGAAARGQSARGQWQRARVRSVSDGRGRARQQRRRRRRRGRRARPHAPIYSHYSQAPKSILNPRSAGAPVSGL